MSALGDYIHLSWQGIKKQDGIRGGYINFGTYRPTSNHTNFNEQIFLNHQNLIMAQIALLSKTPEELKAIENEYNTKIKKEQSFFKELLSNAKKGNAQAKDFVIFVLSLIEKQWDPDFIYEHLVFDNQTGLPYVKFPDSYNSIRELPKYSGQYLIAKPLANYFKRLAGAIYSVYGNSQLQKVRDDIKQLQDMANFIIKEIVPYQSNAKELEKLVIKNNLPIVLDSKKTIQENLEKILKYYHTKAKTIRSSYRSAESFNIEIMANFAEIFGNAIQNSLSTIFQTYLTTTFEDIKRQLLQGQESSNVNGIKINFNTLSYKILKEEFKKNSSIIKVEKDEQGNIIKGELRDINSGKSQKADIILNLDTMYGAAISMKTTNLSKEAETWIKKDRSGKIIKEGFSTVDIQNSSLLLYLSGAEAMDSHLGTHYLNILAEHKDAKEDSLYSQLRKEANSALALHILWSAFTGQGQARNQGFANIFAVYDKYKQLAPGIPRVRFYDMASLINAKYKEMVEEIENISLQNNKIGEDNANTENYSFMRITKVIAQAKKMNILVDISTQVLNNIYKGYH